MSNIFSELKKMSHQFSNALSTMFQLRLVEILHFDTFPLESAQKSMFCMISICRIGFLTSISSEILTLLKHPMRILDTMLEHPRVLLIVLKSHSGIPCSLNNTLSTSVDLSVDQNVSKYEHYAHI